jgi:hypothetical protein
MANKNTLRVRRAMEKSRAFGVAINTTNGGRFQPKLSREDHERVIEIRSHSKRLYGHSA